MTPETWTAVDDYLAHLFVPPDAALDGALAASTAAGLPAIAVSVPQGKFLHILARIRGARRILEVGTLGGYSTIWLARALPPDGRLISLEFDPKHASVARDNLAAAGLSDRVEVRVGRAIDTLPALPANQPFDLVFIDADKPSTPEYLKWALKLTRPGSIIVVDNVVRSGDVLVMLSQPTFDPNLFSGGIDAASWRALTGDEWDPLRNRAIQNHYPPGSTQCSP